MSCNLSRTVLPIFPNVDSARAVLKNDTQIHAILLMINDFLGLCYFSGVLTCTTQLNLRRATNILLMLCLSTTDMQFPNDKIDPASMIHLDAQQQLYLDANSKCLYY